MRALTFEVKDADPGTSKIGIYTAPVSKQAPLASLAKPAGLDNQPSGLALFECDATAFGWCFQLVLPLWEMFLVLKAQRSGESQTLGGSNRRYSGSFPPPLPPAACASSGHPRTG